MGLIVNEILVKTTHVNCSNIECVPHTLSNLLHTSRRKAFLLARINLLSLQQCTLASSRKKKSVFDPVFKVR